MKIVEPKFRPKCEPETVARLRRLADLLESGECNQVVVMWVDRSTSDFENIIFASPSDALLMTTLMNQLAIDGVYQRVVV